jgi:hypothetical protein
MHRIELDFLRTRPKVPLAAWLLLAAGAGFLMLVIWQHGLVTEAMRLETARAAQLAREAKLAGMRQPGRTARVEAGQVDQDLLERRWGELFLALERSRPAKVALLDLEADGRKSLVMLTAEARTPAQMLDYVNALRTQPGLSGVTLTSHMVDDENPQRPVQFAVRFNWGQP